MGRSWGTTLALAYAEGHQDRVCAWCSSACSPHGVRSSIGCIEAAPRGCSPPRGTDFVAALAAGECTDPIACVLPPAHIR